MTRQKLLDRSQYRPPEHFDDEIRAYRSSSRYVPTPLETLLFELAGHMCTICKAPWLEIHHILELAENGLTEYENLIVLCPNCHSRVHKEGVPTKNELRNYKSKQEIAYELPVLSRLSQPEKDFLNQFENYSLEDKLVFSSTSSEVIAAQSEDEAIEELKRKVGMFTLQESGMISVTSETVVRSTFETNYPITLRTSLTSKGSKWLRYLKSTGRLPV